MKAISRQKFDSFINSMKFNTKLDFDFIYDAYVLCMENISEISVEVNSHTLINYCIGEYLYSTKDLTPEEINILKNNENALASMASIALDKYITLTVFNSKQPGLMNKFLPPISSLNTYLNFMLNILNKYNKGSLQDKLIKDLLTKAVSISRCILELLVGGYVTEAFGTWRTLHECESVLALLNKYKGPLIDEYVKFMNYGIAYRDGEDDYNKYAYVFEEIKANMAKHDLKSKDIKKYIEYGWLYKVNELGYDDVVKLNFKDGIEKIAGLSKYGKRFSMASEIIHSTPLLIYPNNDYFYFLTLLSVYESFFRLEEAFVNLFAPVVGKDIIANYLQMKEVYYVQIQNIYKRELQTFLKITKK